jgi:ABC-2 type transport system ATP-binding protein
MTRKNIIEVKKLAKRYGGFTAVKGISFAVREGELFGFLGPNGAGKSTTINMMCTVLRVTEGTADINGHDIVREQARVRRDIGIIFQDPSLDDNLTALENLKLHCVMYNVDKAVREQRIKEVLEMVELADRKDGLVKTFSGGMKRRLEIARGLLHYPRVLFLDEPTIGLDPQTRSYIWKYIMDLRKRENITVFLTTHYMDEAEYCDRVAIMDHGELVALDTPANLKSAVGGDVIRLRTGDDGRAAEVIRQKYGFPVTREQDGISFSVNSGEEFLAPFVKEFPVRILSIGMNRPTLNDVFLKITGRDLRDEELSSGDRFREAMRRNMAGTRGGPGRH